MSESGSLWAVIVGSSQYWHNYRHVSGALTMYDAVRTLGVPDSQIVLMLAGDTPCDARNAAPGRVVSERPDGPNLYRPDLQVDYRGAEVTAEAFLRVLTNTLPADTPASRRLGTLTRTLSPSPSLSLSLSLSLTLTSFVTASANGEYRVQLPALQSAQPVPLLKYITTPRWRPVPVFVDASLGALTLTLTLTQP